MLSKRLSAIASLVPDEANCADIGTDHAYLLLELAQKNQQRKLIGVEVNRKPWEAGKSNIEEAGYAQKIDIRSGFGLTVIEPGEVQVVVIAGMGSSTMIDILERSPEVVGQLDRIILQPMVGVEQIRIWLREKGFSIVDEELVFEDGQYYHIILAYPGEGESDEQCQQGEISPILLIKNHPLLPDYINFLIGKYENIVKQLVYHQGNEENRVKLLEIEKKLGRLKAVKNSVRKGSNDH